MLVNIIFILLLSLFCGLFCHELGHYVIGKIVGVNDIKLKFIWTTWFTIKGFNIKFIKGLVTWTWPNEEFKSSWKRRLLGAGGFIFEILSSVILCWSPISSIVSIGVLYLVGAHIITYNIINKNSPYNDFNHIFLDDI